MRLSCIFLSCLAVILRTSSALVIEGEVSSTSAYQLIGRFCYTKTDDAANIMGKVEYEFDFPVTQVGGIGNLGVLLFYEGVSDFYGAWQNSKSCTEKWNYAAGRHHQRTGIDNAFPLNDVENLKYITNDANTSTIVRYASSVPFKTSRARFFFVILANCNPGKCSKIKAKKGAKKQLPGTKQTETDGLCEGPLTGVHYKLTLNNLGVAPAFLEPFSWDEVWNPITSYTLVILQLGLAILCFYATMELNKLHKFHHSVSILNAAVMAQFAGMLMYSISYSVFSVEGRVFEVHTTNAIIAMFLAVFCCLVISVLAGIICHIHPVSQGLMGMLNWPWATFVIASLLEVATSNLIFQTDDPITTQMTNILSFAGRMYTFMADFTFLLVVMILAHGWTIVRRKLSAQARFRLVVIVAFYWCSLIACIIWNEVSWDMAISFSIWETVPGYCILAARMFIYLWFVYTTGATLLRFNRQKKAFYGLFFCVYSVWLVALPITCLVSSQLLPRSYQNKVLFLVNNLVTLFAQGILSFLYVPGIKFTQKIFPFHATFEQMDVMNTFTEDNALDSDEEKTGDGGGKHIMDGVLDDKTVNELMKAEKDILEAVGKNKDKGSKLVPVNSKNKKKDTSRKSKNKKAVQRIVSSVLTDNPTHRIDYRLDSVIFRLDRLFTTVFATHRIVQRIISVSPPKKASEAKDHDGEERKINEDTSKSQRSRPITSSTSAAASRWKSARGIRTTKSGLRAMRSSVDESNDQFVEQTDKPRRRSRRPRRARGGRDNNHDDEAKSSAPEEPRSEPRSEPRGNDAEEEEPTSRRARRPRRQRTNVVNEAAAAAHDEVDDEKFKVKKKRTPEEEAERNERKRRKREKRKKRKERRARRERKKRNEE